MARLKEEDELPDESLFIRSEWQEYFRSAVVHPHSMLAVGTDYSAEHILASVVTLHVRNY